ncbi:MAG: YvcK family protein [Candidatus Wildermuthbacteria bacterium]|nr:YvcK family protein [Candidatus Wildermuthbacteria bacterium]
MSQTKNIVVIGGGTGTYTALVGLKKYPVNLTAIVSMADDGGSTKVLREEFGVLPPGSVRPALVALSHAPQAISNLFQFRFAEGGLSGHSFGNLFLTALAKQLGSFEKAIEEAGRILNIQGRVIPSTLDNCTLLAELENGQVIRGETNIDIPKHDGNLKIRKVRLDLRCKANPKAIEAIKEADVVVIGPGDLYTSIMPNFLVEGVAKAVRESKAKKAFVCNLMTKFGETNGFSAENFVDALEKYLGERVLTHIIVNTKRPAPERVQKYEEAHAHFVEYDKKKLKENGLKVIEEDVLRPVGLIRHNSDVLARIICKL